MQLISITKIKICENIRSIFNIQKTEKFRFQIITRLETIIFYMW